MPWHRQIRSRSLVFKKLVIIRRFAAKALRLVMNEIGNVTCFENQSWASPQVRKSAIAD